MPVDKCREKVNIDRGYEEFTLVYNALAQDDRLDWNTRGVALYMLSLPEDWDIYKSEIQKHGRDGRTRFNKIWKELQRYGYLTKERLKSENGQFAGVEWTFHHVPVEVNEPELDAEVQEIEAIETEASELMSTTVQKVFEPEFDTIDSLDETLLTEDDKQQIKDEFENEFFELENFEEAPKITQRFQKAWEYTQEHCINHDFFAQYLVNNMKKQATLYRLDQAKIRIEALKLKHINIPMDGDWGSAQ